MAEHPAVAFLLAARQQAEAWAQAATPGPWTLDLGDETILSESGTVARMRDWVRCMSNAQVEADMRLIAGMAEPDAVLRRIAAERELLAEHCNTNSGDCAVCVVGQWGYPTHGGCSPASWPCRTVLLLAKGWGWEEAP